MVSLALASAAVQRHLLLHGIDNIVVIFVLDEQHGESFSFAIRTHVGDERARYIVPFFCEEVVDLGVECLGIIFYDQFLFHGYDVLFLAIRLMILHFSASICSKWRSALLAKLKNGFSSGCIANKNLF